MPVEEKVRLADFVIDNNSSIENTEKQINKLHRNLKSSRFHWIVRAVFITGVILLMAVVSGMVALFRWIF
jgi:hypothetical protein